MFELNQKVMRICDGRLATVLEIVEIEGLYIYKIAYDEGVSEGNDGTGWWDEDALSLSG
jgi:hypothetical protein